MAELPECAGNCKTGLTSILPDVLEGYGHEVRLRALQAMVGTAVRLEADEPGITARELTYSLLEQPVAHYFPEQARDYQPNFTRSRVAVATAFCAQRGCTAFSVLNMLQQSRLSPAEALTVVAEAELGPVISRNEVF